ncbi:MAG: hypothetical protein AAGJ80_12620, partial [Cyanobacteria bacterium J06553_1]
QIFLVTSVIYLGLRAVGALLLLAISIVATPWPEYKNSIFPCGSNALFYISGHGVATMLPFHQPTTQREGKGRMDTNKPTLIQKENKTNIQTKT